MASCEKCWGRAFTRAYGDHSKMQSEHYVDILAERDAAGLVCSPEEQAGQWWDEALGCDSRDKREQGA